MEKKQTKHVKKIQIKVKTAMKAGGIIDTFIPDEK